MNFAPLLPVTQLTEDQAVDELARILDSAPPEDDALALIHWKQANSARAQQLEAHIIHLQRVTAGATNASDSATELPIDEKPAPIPELVNSQDAPPHHLQPEPSPGPAVVAKERTVSPRKTPKEKLQSLVDSYHVLVDKLQDDPTNRRYRDDASTCKSRMNSMEREFHLTRPELRPIPPIKMGRPVGVPLAAPKGSLVIDQVLDRFVLEPPAADEALPEEGEIAPGGIRGPYPETSTKVGPGPYIPPTAEDLCAMFPSHAPTTEELVQGCLPPHSPERIHEIAADLAVAIDGATRGPEAIRRLRQKLRDLRHDLVPVLIQLENLTPQERAIASEDFQSFLNLALTAEILMGEPDLSQVG